MKLLCMQNFQVMFGDNYPNAAVFGTDANGSTVTIMVAICCGRFTSSGKNNSSTLIYNAMLLAYPQSDVHSQYYNMPNTTILRDSVSGASTLNNVGLFIDSSESNDVQYGVAGASGALVIGVFGSAMYSGDFATAGGGAIILDQVNKSTTTEGQGGEGMISYVLPGCQIKGPDRRRGLLQECGTSGTEATGVADGGLDTTESTSVLSEGVVSGGADAEAELTADALMPEFIMVAVVIEIGFSVYEHQQKAKQAQMEGAINQLAITLGQVDAETTAIQTAVRC